MTLHYHRLLRLEVVRQGICGPSILLAPRAPLMAIHDYSSV